MAVEQRNRGAGYGALIAVAIPLFTGVIAASAHPEWDIRTDLAFEMCTYGSVASDLFTLGIALAALTAAVFALKLASKMECAMETVSGVAILMSGVLTLSVALVGAPEDMKSPLIAIFVTILLITMSALTVCSYVRGKVLAGGFSLMLVVIALSYLAFKDAEFGINVTLACFAFTLIIQNISMLLGDGEVTPL
ncbi:MAG: hypothetical protein GX224_06425 [Thermoplasmatales archaeon]|nr:hypothetical protein [Thermoplasmatales archaeon]